MSNLFSFTEAGGHVTNEDAFLVEPHPADPECLLCALADGQGGRAGGRRAAEVACRTAIDAARGWAVADLRKPVIWSHLLGAADGAVEADPEAGFTTLVGFCVCGTELAGASSGDSALLLIRGALAVELTKDQTKNPPVGSGAATFVPFGAALRTPWKVLAMSDGVWKYARWENITEAAKRQSGNDLIDALAAKARLPGSGKFQDDFTVVVIESQ
jgi:serine/threonine protein phosphatase PrpC